MKTLVADDSSDTRLLLADLLSQWGHEVTSATDGHDAWRALSGKEAPRLVILDWVMPRVNGVELCRRLREGDSGNPFYIIVLTSKAGQNDIVTALEAGANDYMVKPFNFDELRARVQVGCRVLELQARLRDQERLQGVLQMAGTVCHEMNQPLQIILTSSELLSANVRPEDPNYELVTTIQESARRLGTVTRRIMKITTPRTCGYLGTRKQIIDLSDAPEPN